jgi:hypothetical protein
MSQKWSSIKRNVSSDTNVEVSETERTGPYPIELMVEFAARDILVPASSDANYRVFYRNVYDVASQIAHRFTENNTEWTNYGRALESYEKPTNLAR